MIVNYYDSLERQVQLFLEIYDPAKSSGSGRRSVFEV